MKNYPKITAAIVLVFVLVISIIVKQLVPLFVNNEEQTVSSQISSIATEQTNTEPIVSNTAEEEEEMRAVWVPFMSLTMSSESDKSEAAFQKKFDEIVKTSKEKGMNTLIVQVRPFGDAFYRSSLFPWSHLLTGTQGQDPGYDPLEYMVKAAHENGLEIHAWVNPLRIQLNTNPSELAENNPYTQWSQDESKKRWVVEYESGKYFNPAYTEVRLFRIMMWTEFNLMIIFIQRRTVSLTKRNTMLIKKKQAKTAFLWNYWSGGRQILTLWFPKYMQRSNKQNRK